MKDVLSPKMSQDFVELFSSLGLDNLTEQCLLFIIGEYAREECGVKEACAVSSAWNAAVCRHVLGTVKGQRALQQRRMESELDLKRLTTIYVTRASTAGNRVLRAAIAGAVIESIQSGCKEAMRRVYREHGKDLVHEIVRCNLLDEFFIPLVAGFDSLIPIRTWRHLMWKEQGCHSFDGQQMDLCLFLRGVLRAHHHVFRVTLSDFAVLRSCA